MLLSFADLEKPLAVELANRPPHRGPGNSSTSASAYVQAAAELDDEQEP